MTASAGSRGGLVDALIAGQRDPEVLAELAKGRMRTKIPQLQGVLAGRFKTTTACCAGRCWPHRPGARHRGLPRGAHLRTLDPLRSGGVVARDDPGGGDGPPEGRAILGG